MHVEKNRVRLHTIVDAVITCGRQNIALQVHRDDSQFQLVGEIKHAKFYSVLANKMENILELQLESKEIYEKAVYVHCNSHFLNHRIFANSNSLGHDG
jgi:hypothetical protein